jgi:hypothetical protein
MARKEDLQWHIRESGSLILEYEDKHRLASDPKEKASCQRQITEQWALIRGWLREYERVAPSGWSEDLRQIAARLEEKGSAAAAVPQGESLSQATMQVTSTLTIEQMKGGRVTAVDLSGEFHGPVDVRVQ